MEIENSPKMFVEFWERSRSNNINNVLVSQILVSVISILVIYRIYKFMFYKPPNFPPGKIMYFISEFRIKLENNLAKASPIKLNSLKYYRFLTINCFVGPPRIPRFGSYLILLLVNYSQIHKAISALSKYYKTNILGFYLGDTLTIVANDTASVKELLLNTAFDGRPDVEIAKARDPDHGPRGITQNLHNYKYVFI